MVFNGADVEAAAQATASAIRDQIGTREQLDELILRIFREELPGFFPAPAPPSPPAPPAGTGGGT